MGMRILVMCVRMKKVVEPDGEVYVVGVGFVGLSRADKMPGVICEERVRSENQGGVYWGCQIQGEIRGVFQEPISRGPLSRVRDR